MSQPRVLLFTRTTGYRHESIADGAAMMHGLGDRDGFGVDHTEDAAAFTEANLQRYAAVVWLSTSGTVLDAAQRKAFASWLSGGGRFAGIHGAAACEEEWPAYDAIIGARFERHPDVQPGVVVPEDRTHPSTAHLPDRWPRVDEWYTFDRNPRGQVRVLATLDEATYEDGGMGPDHPIAWCGTYGEGSTWYTALGHTSASYGEPLFVEHVAGGLRSLLSQ